MKPTHQVVALGENKENGDFEIALGENENGNFRFTLPPYFKFSLTPVDEDGNNMPVSSIIVENRTTIIHVPESSSQFKLKVTKPGRPSPKDESGKAVTAGDDESGDNQKGDFLEKFIRFMGENDRGMEERLIEAVKGASQEIIIKKVTG